MRKLLLASLLVLTVSTVYATVEPQETKVEMEAVAEVVKEHVNNVQISDEMKVDLVNVFENALDKNHDFEQLGSDLGAFLAKTTEEDKKAIMEYYKENHAGFEMIMEKKKEEMRRR